MKVTQLIEKYRFLFLLTFIVVTISMMFYGFGLLDSIIMSLILSTIATTIKYYGDMFFDKITRRWFSKNKQ